jgi:hypothetical protein
MAHDATFVAGIRQVRDDVLGLICDGNMLRSEINDQRWHTSSTLKGSAILPPYASRSKSLEVLIPILYLKGVSTGDFEEALVALLGKDTGGLSASTIGRLKDSKSHETSSIDIPAFSAARDGI